MKFLFICIFFSSLLFSQEESLSDNRVVKTSELELFLFKVGFESLLKDVDSTKSKATNNQNDIKDLKDKVKIIMDEVYKDKRVLLDSNATSSNKEIQALKLQLEILQEEVNKLKNKKIVQRNKKENTFSSAVVNTNILQVREKAVVESDIIYNIKKGTEVKLLECDNFDWCKIQIKNKEGFVPKYLLKFL
ncbi:SH3 domain-containing protein [Arcobacter sp. YIC-80]|uniref:SH3 domain-containing protein n=1 Tax=Arcobacter sp. YIC-80 TaxID=3376683 RepID=UPI00384CA65E